MNKQLDIKNFFSTPHPEILLNCYNNQTYHIGDYAHVKLRNKNGKKFWKMLRKI